MADAILESQARSLKRWDDRQQEWDAVNNKLAQKLGRKPGDTLANNIWRYREKIEKMEAVENSIPRSERGNPNDWQMELRGGGEAIRYVRVGGRHQPLYLPIRDQTKELRDAKIISGASTVARDPATAAAVRPERSITESQYFKQKEQVLKKAIAKKYPHHSIPHEGNFVIEGQAAPVTAEPFAEDEDAADGFGWTQPLQPTKPVCAADEQIENEEQLPDTSAERQDSAPSSPVRGPALEMAAEHITFNTAPNDLVQSSLLVKNVGTTAVYYTWKPCIIESIVPKPEGKEKYFQLSDVPTGVMLPDEERYFTFSFQHSAAGCYTDVWELETVPKGPKELFVDLRGVVVSRDEDPIRRQELDSTITAKLTHAGMHAFFTQVLNQQQDNVFSTSDAQRKADEEARKAAFEQEAKEKKELQRQKQWARYNSGLRLHYSTMVYEQLEQLHNNIHVYLQVVGSPPGSGIGLAASDGVDLVVAPWSGSVTHLSEEIQQVEDPQVRAPLWAAFTDLLAAARFDHPPGSEVASLVSESGAQPLFAYACMHNALFSFADQFVERSHSLQVQMGLIEEHEAPAGGKKGKDAKGIKKKEEPMKKAPPPDPKAKKGKKDEPGHAMESEEETRLRLQGEYRDRADTEAKQIMEDVIFQFCSQLDSMECRQEEVLGDLCMTFRTCILEQEEAYRVQVQEEKLAAEREREAREKAEREGVEEDKAAEDKKKKKK
jgi:hypothetical protein